MSASMIDIGSHDLSPSSPFDSPPCRCRFDSERMIRDTSSAKLPLA